jgi:hypothetical protein
LETSGEAVYERSQVHLSSPFPTTQGLPDVEVALFSPLAQFFVERLPILTLRSVSLFSCPK